MKKCLSKLGHHCRLETPPLASSVQLFFFWASKIIQSALLTISGRKTLLDAHYFVCAPDFNHGYTAFLTNTLEPRKPAPGSNIADWTLPNCSQRPSCNSCLGESNSRQYKRRHSSHHPNANCNPSDHHREYSIPNSAEMGFQQITVVSVA